LGEELQESVGECEMVSWGSRESWREDRGKGETLKVEDILEEGDNGGRSGGYVKEGSLDSW